MIVCYLDDSGTGEEPILTMAGYIGRRQQWDEFEVAAQAILDRFGVRELHGKEFNATKNDFKGWPRRKKEAFVAQLYRQLRTTARALGVDFGITRSAYNRARFEFGSAPNESRYGTCFRGIVDFIMRSDYMKFHVANYKATLSFMVEAGNKNDADIKRVFDEMKFNPVHVGVVDVMNTVSFVGKRSSIALQMADLLAFHSRRYKSQCEAARRYLPLTDLQQVIFHGVDTKTNLNFEFRTNDEIASGYRDPTSWRQETDDSNDTI